MNHPSSVARCTSGVACGSCRLHVCHVSTARSVERIRRAKADGLPVTAEATPHHLILTVEAVAASGADAKMNPPLASAADRESVRAALADGTIDCVATDHAPHTDAEKRRGLEDAPFGIVGLETAFPLLYTDLVLGGELPLGTLVRRLSADPARVMRIEEPRIRSGAPADLAAFDTESEWIVEPDRFRSRGRNTPFAGWRLRGRPVYTIAGGRVAYDGLASRAGYLR